MAFRRTPLFCHSCLVHCQSLIFQKFSGTGIFIWPPQHIYIVINKSDYHSKLQTILNDKNKFTKLNHNPTHQRKSKINKLINANNAELHNIKLPKIIGDYKPDSVYGTVKIHKPGYPLGQIISQITTPIKQPTKTITDQITQYLSHNYSIKSTKEPFEILKTHKPNKGIMSSPDVKNIFTNVPIRETINIDNIYYHPMLPPLKINSNTLRKIFLPCTTEVPFYDPHGNIYIQNDGIAMGSVLGPIFSYFCMSALETEVFNTINKPNIYLRYADDILLFTNSTDEINTIQRPFKIILFSISHKKSISTIKSHFLMY